MERQTPVPRQIKEDGAARRAKTRHFPLFDFGERGAVVVGFPFMLSKIVGQAKPKSGALAELCKLFGKRSLKIAKKSTKYSFPK